MIRRLHRWNAVALGLFLALHFSNHLVFAAGVEAHLAVLKSLRRLYRPVVIEVTLLALFLAQIGLGLALARRTCRNRTGWGQA